MATTRKAILSFLLLLSFLIFSLASPPQRPKLPKAFVGSNQINQIFLNCKAVAASSFVVDLGRAQQKGAFWRWIFKAAANAPATPIKSPKSARSKRTSSLSLSSKPILEPRPSPKIIPGPIFIPQVFPTPSPSPSPSPRVVSLHTLFPISIKPSPKSSGRPAFVLATDRLNPDVNVDVLNVLMFANTSKNSSVSVLCGTVYSRRTYTGLPTPAPTPASREVGEENVCSEEFCREHLESPCVSPAGTLLCGQTIEASCYSLSIAFEGKKKRGLEERKNRGERNVRKFPFAKRQDRIWCDLWAISCDDCFTKGANGVTCLTSAEQGGNCCLCMSTWL